MAVCAPSNLAVDTVGATSARLTWDISTPSGPPVVWKTYVERSDSGGGWVVVREISGGSYTMVWTDTTLADGTAYSWRVRTQDVDLNYSSYCTAAGCTTVLPAPTGIHFTATPTTVTIYWTDNSQNETGFQVWMGGSLIYTTAANAVSYPKSGLTAGNWYNFEVNAVNAICQSDGIAGSCFTADPPNAPDNLALTATGTTTIGVTFRDNSDNETGFKVEYKALGGAYGAWATLGAGVTNTTITGLTSNTLYYVRVCATNGSGDSAWCTEAMVSTLAAVAQPTGLTATPWGAQTIEVCFQDNSSGETDHRVSRRVHSTDLADKISNGTFDSATTGWTFADCTAASVAGGYPGNCLQLTRTGGSSQYGYQALTLVNGKSYYVFGYVKSGTSGNETYKIYDNVGGGGSYASPLLTGTTSAAWTFVGGFYTATGTTGSLKLLKDSATAGTMLFDSFHVYQCDPWVEVKTLEPNRTFWRNTGLTAGITYDFTVRARQSGSPDVYSLYADPVYATVLDVPADPTNLVISEYQDTWVRLTWTKTTGESGYEIYRAPHGGSYTLYRTVDKGIEYCRVSGLAASTEYDFKIRAVNAAGNSGYTSVVTQITRAAYLPSAFETLCLMTKKNIYHLIEIRPRQVLSGWSLTAGKTYTYEYAIPAVDSGITFDAVFENGVSLTAKTSTATVEATAGTFWCDTANAKLYVHAVNGGNPADFLYVGSFWLYFHAGSIS